MSNFAVDENGVLMRYSGCDRIVRIPDGVKEIGRLGVFPIRGGEYIEEVIFPESTTEISYDVFSGCTNLKKITFLGHALKRISGGAFKACTALESVELPDGLEDIGWAFQDCTGLRSVVLPKTMTQIGSYAFSGCTALESVTFPPNLQSIGDNAFENCTSLRKVELPNTVKKLGICCFDKCENLEHIRLPEHMEEIGWYAFNKTGKLTGLCIPEGITQFDHPIVLGWSGIQSLSIPSSVTTPWPSIVYGCGKLKTITVRNSGNAGFTDCVNVPEYQRSQSGVSEVSFTPVEFLNACMKADLSIDPWILCFNVPINTAEAGYATVYRNSKPWHDRIDEALLRKKIYAEEVCREMTALVSQAGSALKSPEYHRVFDFAAAHKTEVHSDIRNELAHALINNNPKTAKLLAWAELLGDDAAALLPQEPKKEKTSTAAIVFTEDEKIAKVNEIPASCLFALKKTKVNSDNERTRLYSQNLRFGEDQVVSRIDPENPMRDDLTYTFTKAVFRGLTHQIRAAVSYIREHSGYYAVHDIKIVPTASPIVFEITIGNHLEDFIVDQVMANFPELKMAAFFETCLSYVFLVYSDVGHSKPTLTYEIGEVDHKQDIPWTEDSSPEYDVRVSYTDTRTGERVRIREAFARKKEWESFDYLIREGANYYQITQVNVPDSVKRIGAKAFANSRILKKITVAPGTRVDAGACEGSKNAVIEERSV